jgi:hypothetical protein
VSIDVTKDISLKSRQDETFVLLVGLDYEAQYERPLVWCKIHHPSPGPLNLKQIWEECVTFGDKRHHLQARYSDKLISFTIVAHDETSLIESNVFYIQLKPSKASEL